MLSVPKEVFMKKSKGWFITVLLFLLLLLSGSGYFLYSLSLLTGIETTLRIWVSVGVGILFFVFLLLGVRALKKQKKWKLFLFLFFTLLFSVLFFFGANNIDRVVGKISKVTTSSTTYSSSLVTTKENKVEDIKEIGDSKLGILSDTTSIEGNIIPKEIIKDLKLTNDVDEYDSYVSLIQDLQEGNIDYIFLPTNYSILFANMDGMERLQDETKILYTQTKEVKETISKKNNNQLTEPFTILLMGVDSELENIKGSSFNGDSLMLITFNPTTLNATILSIPRDSYVPIACFTGQRKNKITHAAWYGQDCMIETIENFTGITIDYYAKINFKGVVKLVDALGGVDVDVEYSFCEQDSNRSWGNNTVYVEKGYQTLSGEQALAYARNRHANPSYCSSKWTNYTSNDFVRGQHQQQIVKALLNKVKSIRSLDTFYELLDVVSNSMETNLSTSEILSLYNIAKDVLAKNTNSDVDELISMQRLYLSGYDATIYDYNPISGQGTRMRLYNFVPYKGSISDIVKAMKVNLGLEEAEVEKTFTFDVENEYKETVIGKGTYNESTISLLKDLTGYTESEARSYASNNNISLTVKEVNATSASQKIGEVIEQSIPYGTDMEYVKSLTISVVTKEYENKNSSTTSLDCSLEENSENVKCAMPTFKGETLSFVKNWFKNMGYDIQVKYTEKSATDTGWSEEVAGTVYSQSTTNAYLYDYINTGKTFEIIYWEEANEKEGE